MKRLAWLMCLCGAVGCQEKAAPIRLAPPEEAPIIGHYRPANAPVRTNRRPKSTVIAPETIGGSGRTILADPSFVPFQQSSNDVDLGALQFRSSFAETRVSDQATLIQEARVLAEQRNFPEALEKLHQFNREDPQNPQAYELMGLIYNANGDYGKAALNYDVAIKLSPNGTLYAQRGAVNLRLGMLDQAVHDFTKAIELGVNEPVVYLNRSIAQLNNRHHEEAVADANKALELNSEFADAYFVRSLAKLFARQIAEARVDFNKAVSLGLDADAKALGERYFAQAANAR